MESTKQGLAMPALQEWRETMPYDRKPAKETGTGTERETIEEAKDYGECRDRLYFRLVNTERNRGLLEKALHREIMDLSIMCYALMGHTGDGITSVLVTCSLAGYWGMQAEEIMAQAVQNTPKIFPVKTDSLLSVLEKLSGTGKTGMHREGEEKWEPFIMTNIYGIDGFGAVLYPQALKDFADAIGENLYVLPSSRHEALLLPAGGDFTADDLRGMVRSVNETEVAEEDILSYHVYFYDRAKNELKVTGKEDVCVRL